MIGFLLVAAAGMTVRPGTDDPVRRPTQHTRATAVPVPSVLGMALPYVPLLGAVAALIANRITGARTPTVNLVLGASLIVVVLIRQFLAMTDNRRLLVALGEARDQLEHQALHDALTGLANRVLFADRLDRALLQPAAAVSVLFCDLDDFKLVNDERGHEAGDVLLREVARRLLECVRATDTVARLGGDEFAILLEDSADAAHVADRVVTAMRQPVSVDGREVRTSISVGVAHHEGGTAPADERREPGRRTAQAGVATVPAAHRETTAQLLLRTADTAMYAAKGAGKSRAVLAEEPTGART